MLKIYIYWHKCSCHGCDDDDGRNVKIELEYAGIAKTASEIHCGHNRLPLVVYLWSTSGLLVV